jgi:RNA recognition motif-containing protein
MYNSRSFGVGGGGRGAPVAQSAQETSRTVYVGNLSATVSLAELSSFFAICGPISFARLSATRDLQSRYAFVEFVSQESAAKAMSMHGVHLGDAPIRVSSSNHPITKQPLVATPLARNGAELDQLHRAVSIIDARIAAKVAARVGAAEAASSSIEQERGRGQQLGSDQGQERGRDQDQKRDDDVPQSSIENDSAAMDDDDDRKDDAVEAAVEAAVDDDDDDDDDDDGRPNE